MDFPHGLSPSSAAMFERNVSWLKQREARQSQILNALLSREAEGLQSSPRINERSARLAMNRSSEDVVTRLFRDGQQMQASKAMLAKEITALEAPGFPAITRHAAELKRDGAVGDRLFADAQKMKEKRAELVSHLLQQEREASAPLPKPSGRRGSTGGGETGHTHKSRQHSVEQLYREAEAREQRRKEALAAADREAKENAKPMLNAHSLALAAKIPQEKLARMYKKDIEGLVPVHRRTGTAGGAGDMEGTTGSAAVQQQPQVSSADELPADATFHPKIAEKSKQLAAKRLKEEWAREGGGSPGPVEERLYKEAARKEEKMRELARLHSEHELQGCTFFPNTDPRPRALPPASPGGGVADSTVAGGSTAAGPGGSPRHVVRSAEVAELFKRHTAWQVEREKKLEEARQAEKERELQACTFQPELGPAGRAAARRASISGGVALPGGGSRAGAGGARSGTEMLLALAGGSSTSKGLATKRARRSSMPGAVGSGSGLEYATGGVGDGSARALVDDIPGIDKFSKRLEAGRKLKAEKDHPSWIPDGSKWTGKTQAVAPVLRTAALAEHSSAASANGGGVSAGAAANTGAGPRSQGTGQPVASPLVAGKQQPGGRSSVAAGTSSGAVTVHSRPPPTQPASSALTGPGAQLLAIAMARDQQAGPVQPLAAADRPSTAQAAAATGRPGTAPAVAAAKKTPEEIIQETIARSLGALTGGSSSASGAGALPVPPSSSSTWASTGTGTGAGAGAGGAELATAEDIRARLKAIEYMRSAATAQQSAAAAPAVRSTGGTQLRTTLLVSSSSSAAPPAAGAAGPVLVTTSGPASSAFSTFNRGGSAGAGSMDMARAEPPQMRFTSRPGSSSHASASLGGAHVGAGADPLLARVEAMAAAAAQR